MKILVFANDMSWNELIAGSFGIEWMRAENIDSFANREGTDAYFNLSENILETDYSFLKKPVFINSVPVTLQKITVAENVIRINGWNGFLQRSSWEIAGKINDHSQEVLKTINKKILAYKVQNKEQRSSAGIA